VCVVDAHAASLGDGDHGRRRMGENLEGFADQSETDVLQSGERPSQPVAWWVAEHQQSFGMVGCRGQETRVVGVAAHDPVHYEDVVRLDFVRCGRNVDLAACHPAAHPGRLREFGGVGVVGVDEFEGGGPARPLAEQLELDVTDTASYLKDASAVDSSVDEVGDYPGRGLVEAAFAVPGGEVSSEPGPEHVIASARGRSSRSCQQYPRARGCCAARGGHSVASYGLRIALPVWAPAARHRGPIRS
jgi:hypothetical protein